MWCHDMCTTLQREDIFIALRWYTYVYYIAMFIYVCQIVIKILCSSNYDIRKCSWDFNVTICSSHCDVTVFGRLQHHYDRHIATFGASFDLAECCDFIQRYHNINSTVLCRIYYLYDHLYVVNNWSYTHIRSVS